MIEKPRLLFVVTNQLFVRNYFKTSALEQLEREYDCTFLVSTELTDASPIDNGTRKVITYRYDRERAKTQYKIYKIFMWRFRKLSSTFRFRIERTHVSKYPYRPNTLTNVPYNMLAAVHAIGISYRKARMALLATDPFFGLYRRLAVDSLSPNPDLAEKIAAQRPDLIVVPSSAFDPDANDVLLQARKTGTRTLFLIDNWDNLSSKSVMWLKPDHLGVWGRQSAEHAERIHQFRKDQVTLLGTPRFDDYFKRRHETLPTYFKFKYILFLGTSLAFDEASALQNLNAILDRHQDEFAGVKIVYRPHPWREGKDSIVGMNLKHVVIDPQLEERHLKDERGIQFQPDLSYYPALLKNAEVVVGGLTSMMIEAVIFGKEYIALTYDDGKNVTNQRSVFEKSEHFRGVERIRAIRFCKEMADVEPLLLAGWRARGHLSLAEVDTDRQYILYSDGQSYSERLFQLVNQQISIANGSSPA